MGGFRFLVLLCVTIALCGCSRARRVHTAVCVDEKGYIYKIYSYYCVVGTNVVLDGDFVQWKRMGVMDGRVFRGEMEYRRYEDGRLISGYSGASTGDWTTFGGETWTPKDRGDICIWDLER